MFWGIVLILLGSVFILNNLGYLSFNLWQVIGPVFLILLGLWVIVGQGISKGKFEQVTVPLKQVETAKLRFDFAAGRLWVKGGASQGNLLDGRLSDGFSLNENTRSVDADIRLNLDPQFFPLFWFSLGSEWNVNLNEEALLSLEINSGACEETLDLTGLKIKELKLSTGASKTTVTLPSETGTGKYIVKAGLASVDIRVPKDVGARIRATAGLGTVSVDRNRFSRIGGEYKSQNYDSSEKRVDIYVEVGLGAIEIF